MQHTNIPCEMIVGYGGAKYFESVQFQKETMF